MLGIGAFGWKTFSDVQKEVWAGGRLLLVSLDFEGGDLLDWEGQYWAGELNLMDRGGVDKAGGPTFGELERVCASEILRALTLVLSRPGKPQQ